MGHKPTHKPKGGKRSTASRGKKLGLKSLGKKSLGSRTSAVVRGTSYAKATKSARKIIRSRGVTRIGITGSNPMNARMPNLDEVSANQKRNRGL